MDSAFSCKKDKAGRIHAVTNFFTTREGGRVILQTCTYHLGELDESDRHVLHAWDEGTGEMKALAEFPMTGENRYWYYAMPEEGVILTANTKGIYRTRDGMPHA